MVLGSTPVNTSLLFTVGVMFNKPGDYTIILTHPLFRDSFQYAGFLYKYKKKYLTRV